MNRENRSIAIDGDSGSGKSTVGKILAARLGFLFVDSGLLYRAATFIITNKHKENEPALWTEIIKNSSIDMDDEGKVKINNVFVDIKDLRSEIVDKWVSPVSTIKEIRSIITNLLRRIASDKNVVMVGRDIGTVVLKDAFLKIYLTASLTERAKRRFIELTNKGEKITFQDVLENLKKRDIIDSSRDIAPLTVAQDSVVIDTTDINANEVVNKIIEFYKGREYAVQNGSRSGKSII